MYFFRILLFITMTLSASYSIRESIPSNYGIGYRIIPSLVMMLRHGKSDGSRLSPARNTPVQPWPAGLGSPYRTSLFSSEKAPQQNQSTIEPSSRPGKVQKYWEWKMACHHLKVPLRFGNVNVVDGLSRDSSLNGKTVSHAKQIPHGKERKIPNNVDFFLWRKKFFLLLRPKQHASWSPFSRSLLRYERPVWLQPCAPYPERSDSPGSTTTPFIFCATNNSSTKEKPLDLKKWRAAWRKRRTVRKPARKIWPLRLAMKTPQRFALLCKKSHRSRLNNELNQNESFKVGRLDEITSSSWMSLMV